MTEISNMFIRFGSYFSVPDIGINILDVIILLIFLFYIYEGYMTGFVVAMLDLGSFILSFIVALKTYGILAKFLIDFFAIPLGFANAGGFLIIAVISEIVLSLFVRRYLEKSRIIPPTAKIYQYFSKTDKFFGIFPGLFSAFIIITFLMSLIVSLPTVPVVKKLIIDSKIGSKMVANASVFESGLNELFGGALNDTLNFLTVRPQSDEQVSLNYKYKNGTTDSMEEQEMFEAVNDERIKAGVEPLRFDNSLRDLARAHSQDMFERGYFSHFTPDGKSPFDRMSEFGINFSFAGENLALAPSTKLAMQGLMNSQGHRKNILSPNFGKIGVGVIDGGVHGKMYSQEFTD